MLKKKYIRYRLATLLIFAVLLVSCSGTYYKPTDKTVGDMSVRRARNILATELKGSLIIISERNVPITDARAGSTRLIITDGNGGQSIFVYRDLPQISVGLGGLEVGWVLNLADQPTLSLGRISSGQRDDIPNALHVLQQNALNQQRESEEEEKRFAASLADYINLAAANVELPEEAVRFKVQAEGAVRDKEIDAAADFYAEALKIAPWWPAGHFNRALILSETGDYESAKREMNYYLQLVPYAPNFRAAKNRIYEWERLGAK